MALRLSLIRTYSDMLGGISTPQPPKATYRRDAWENAVLDFAGDKLVVTRHQRKLRLEQRGFIFDQTDAVIHDLLSDSLAPLGLVEPADLERVAPHFLSAFAKDALWNTITGRPDSSGDSTAGGMSPESVFLRARFPHLRFEWHITSPFFELRPLRSGDEYVLRAAWTAWAPPSNFEANPLVARGSMTDRLIIVDGRPLIVHRLFAIENLLQPELMRPKSLHKDPITVPHTPNSDAEARGLVALTASQRTLRTLRSSQNTLGAVVALSALLSSTQPLLDARSHAAGAILAGVGIASALVSVVSLSIGWVLSWVEARAAARQLVDDTDARLCDLERGGSAGTSMTAASKDTTRTVQWEEKR